MGCAWCELGLHAPKDHSGETRTRTEEARWRFAEANVAMLRDALTEFHAFVAAELDPDPHPIEAYLAGWDADRITELRKLLYGAAAPTSEENAR